MLTGYGIRDLDQFTNFFMTDISRLQRCVSDVGKQRGENLISLWKSTALATAAFGNPNSQLPHSRVFIPTCFVVPVYKNYLLEELLLQAVMRT